MDTKIDEIPLSEIISTTNKLEQFKKKGIMTIEDLLKFYPRKYEDHRNTVTPLDVKNKENCTMILQVSSVKRNTSNITAKCYEIKSGKAVSVLWFNMNYLYQKIYNCIGLHVLVSGKFTVSNYGKQFVNPTVFSSDIEQSRIIMPIYSNINGMSNDYIRDSLKIAVLKYKPNEYLSEINLKKFGLIRRENLYQAVHFPKCVEDIKNARNRIIFDELFEYAKLMENQIKNTQMNSSFIPYSLKNCNKVIQNLPYTLTKDQQDVIAKCIDIARKGRRINALIQGDVGCGKTITAFLVMIAMADNGYQSVLMAPTGVLAKQHYDELSSYLKPLGLKCVFLTGTMKPKERKDVLDKIKNGEVQFVIGTHSCINSDIEYANLGLTVVDEEHKFGVIQREKLKIQSNTGVHSISMSASPIPRTLALSMYGDAMQVFTIRTMPKGRKPVKTAITNDDNQIYEFMLREIKKGNQCYVVCPLITTDETQSVDNDDKEPPISVEKAYTNIKSFFEPLGYNVCCITGKTKEDEKTTIINDFTNKTYQILIATTIIEVGVNVPTATVMTIFNADRFGLAGLHQLRGRVGRGNLQSYCILESDDFYNPRLQAMCKTTDGFKIAAEDLQIRGAGDFIGTKQSGDNYYVDLIIRNPDLFKEIQKLLHQSEKLNFTKQ